MQENDGAPAIPAGGNETEDSQMLGTTKYTAEDTAIIVRLMSRETTPPYHTVNSGWKACIAVDLMLAGDANDAALMLDYELDRERYGMAQWWRNNRRANMHGLPIALNHNVVHSEE